MALFTKPHKVKYTDMCIYIDNNAYRDDLTEDEENLIFEYLYHIANMLARNAKYFNRSDYYEDFAIYFATSIFLRYRNPKQYQTDPDTGETKLPKIKSVLNYMKTVVYPRKVEFEQKFYSQIFSNQDECEDVVYNTNFTFSDRLSQSIESISMSEFSMCLGDICKTTRRFLKCIPYRTNKVVWNNIYLSCLLTLLNIITISNRDMERVSELKRDIQERTYLNLYKDTPENSVILYHLDSNMRDYIWILVQEIKHVIAKDLSFSLHTYVPATSSLNAIALADINIEEYNNYGE